MRARSLLDGSTVGITPSATDSTPRPIQSADGHSLRCPCCHYGLLVKLSVMPKPVEQEWLQCNRCTEIIVRPRESR